MWLSLVFLRTMVIKRLLHRYYFLTVTLYGHMSQVKKGYKKTTIWLFWICNRENRLVRHYYLVIYVFNKCVIFITAIQNFLLKIKSTFLTLLRRSKAAMAFESNENMKTDKEVGVLFNTYENLFFKSCFLCVFLACCPLKTVRIQFWDKVWCLSWSVLDLGIFISKVHTLMIVLITGAVRWSPMKLLC